MKSSKRAKAKRANIWQPKSATFKKIPTQAKLAEAQRSLGYVFRNERLLEEALTHSSDPNRASYQRLEFVGDAALTLAFTNYFYLSDPDLGPGELSTLRAANISTEKLARAAVHHGLYHFVRRNTEELDRMVEEFTRVVMRERGDEIGGLSFGGNTKKAPKVLADIVESIAAAIYIDSDMNLEKLWTVFKPILAPIITSETLDEQPVTSLYELCQKHGKSIQFKNSSRGTRNIVKVFIDGKLIGSCSSEQKHIAKLNAARHALQQLSSSEESDETEEESCNLPVAGEEGAKKMLNELCSKSHWENPKYRIVKEQGPPHDRRFTCLVEVNTSDGKVTTVSDAMPRIKDAENDAASKMLPKVSK